MTDKNMKKSQKNSALPKEDIQLYRLFAIFGAAILGFAALNLVNESKLLGFLLRGGIWGALVLLLLAIAWPIYIRCIRKIDESGKIFTSVGVSYFLIPVFLMLVAYPTLNNANVKYQVAFAGISIFAVIYNVFKREFKNITALTFVCAALLYYVHAATYNWLEDAIAFVSKILIFLIPAAVVLLLVSAFRSKNGSVKISGHEIYRLPSRFAGILALILCVFFLLAGVLLLLVPESYLYIMVSLLALYVIVGIVCTIRLI
jgi:membrane protein